MGLFDALEGSYIDYTATTRTPRGSFVDALSQVTAPSDTRHIGALRQLEGIHGEMLKTGSGLSKRAATFEASKNAQVAAIMKYAGGESGVNAKKMALAASMANQGAENQLASDFTAASLNSTANLNNIRKRRMFVASLIKGSGELLAFGASKFGEDEDPAPYGSEYDEETQARLKAMKGLYSGAGSEGVGYGERQYRVTPGQAPGEDPWPEGASDRALHNEFRSFFRDYSDLESGGSNWEPTLRNREGLAGGYTRENI